MPINQLAVFSQTHTHTHTHTSSRAVSIRIISNESERATRELGNYIWIYSDWNPHGRDLYKSAQSSSSNNNRLNWTHRSRPFSFANFGQHDRCTRFQIEYSRRSTSLFLFLFLSPLTIGNGIDKIIINEINTIIARSRHDHRAHNRAWKK